MLSYLARYTHRVALSNNRLIDANEKGVKFKYKDYRIEGPGRYKMMTLEPGEFIRRFMLHVLPKGFHRIRHYGLLARSRTKTETLARGRELIAAATPARPVQPAKKQQTDDSAARAEKPAHPCPRCGARIVIIGHSKPAARRVIGRSRAYAPLQDRGAAACFTIPTLRHRRQPDLHRAR